MRDLTQSARPPDHPVSWAMLRLSTAMFSGRRRIRRARPRAPSAGARSTPGEVAYLAAAVTVAANSCSAWTSNGHYRQYGDKFGRSGSGVGFCGQRLVCRGNGVARLTGAQRVGLNPILHFCLCPVLTITSALTSVLSLHTPYSV